MLKLDADLCAVCMTGICHTLKAVHASVLEETRLSRAALCLLVYNRGLDGYKSEAALGSSLIVAE